MKLSIFILLAGTLWGQTKQPPTGLLPGSPITGDVVCVNDQAWYYTGKSWVVSVDAHAFACKGSKPEAVDVPAIKEPIDVKVSFDGELFYCNAGAKFNASFDEKKGEYKRWCTGGTVLTCADKSRVLLTSEDGKKHCIKFDQVLQ